MPLTASPSAGPTLRRARELAGIHERTAARELGVRRSRLRAWESGAVAPDADEMDRAIALYSADLDEIWPDRRPLVSPDEPGILMVGDERIDVRTASVVGNDGVTTIDNRVILTRYLAAVRRQRGLGPTDTVELRAGDIASLSTVLDLADAALEHELTELLELTPAGARWASRALVVGALMTVAATAVVGTSWFSSATPAGATPAPTPTAEIAPFAPEVTPVTAVSERAAVQFAPEEISDDIPVDAEIVAPSSAPSPFSTEPAATEAELAPAMFAVAPATEWSPVVDPAAALPAVTPTE